MTAVRAIAGLVLILISLYNLLTIPGLVGAPIHDVSQLTFNGLSVKIVDYRGKAQNTEYGIKRINGKESSIRWVGPEKLRGQLNFFFSWDSYQKVGDSLRTAIITIGFIWLLVVAVFGFVLDESDRDTYLIAVKLCGVMSAIGVFLLLKSEFPYSSAVLSFIPAAGWGIVIPIVGIVLDREMQRNNIDLTVHDILEGMVDQILFSMIAYSILFFGIAPITNANTNAPTESNAAPTLTLRYLEQKGEGKDWFTGRYTAITVARVNLRPCPVSNRRCSPIKVLDIGSIVVLIKQSKNGQWAQVRTKKGTLGWMNKHYLARPTPNAVPKDKRKPSSQ